MIKIIITDIDGILLHSNHKILNRTLEVLKKSINTVLDTRRR